MPTKSSMRCAVVSACVAVSFMGHVWGGDFQSTPVTLKAESVLPSKLLSGTGFQVRDHVSNDGFVNTYEIDTKNHGVLSVEGTPALYARVRELTALTKIAQIGESEAYKSALKKGASSPLKGAEAIVKDPVGTVKGAATGIGRWFSDVGRSIASDDPHQAGVAQTALGQAAVKRGYAYEFGVDPYSAFQPLQKSLDDLAWATAGGGLTMKVAFALIPGAVGIVVSAAGTTDSMRALVRDKSPAELDKINRKKLAAMSVSKNVTERFLKSSFYSPQDKTILVGSLDTLKNVKGRSLFIESAANVQDRGRATFMSFRAQMIAEHHARTKTLGEIVKVGDTLFVSDTRGSLHGHFPIDHLAHTAALAEMIASLDKALGMSKKPASKELWIGGTIDAGARARLEATGWKIHTDQYAHLLKVS